MHSKPPSASKNATRCRACSSRRVGQFCRRVATAELSRRRAQARSALAPVRSVRSSTKRSCRRISLSHGHESTPARLSPRRSEGMQRGRGARSDRHVEDPVASSPRASIRRHRQSRRKMSPVSHRRHSRDHAEVERVGAIPSRTTEPFPKTVTEGARCTVSPQSDRRRPRRPL